MMSCFGKQLSWLPGNNQTQTHPEMLREDKDVLSPTLVEGWRAATQPVSPLLVSDSRGCCQCSALVLTRRWLVPSHSPDGRFRQSVFSGLGFLLYSMFLLFPN